MASTFERLVISIFGHTNLLILHLIKDGTTDVSYSAYIVVKFCPYNPTSSFNVVDWSFTMWTTT